MLGDGVVEWLAQSTWLVRLVGEMTVWAGVPLNDGDRFSVSISIFSASGESSF